jgi:hypothetical protein
VAIAELAGADAHPLDEEIGRAYWTGNDLTATIDSTRLGELLIERFAGQAGHYWDHLTSDLLSEVSPTHAFHVLGVYPWSRLLSTGLPEPLHVLDSCRIRTGQVLAVTESDATVEVDTLRWDGQQLSLTRPREEVVRRRLPEGTFTDTLAVGDHVAIHWGFVCDRLEPHEAETSQDWTYRQVDLTNRRLAG